MKILMFNLGTIKHRILSWEVDGFKSLFEQDIILWGPVPDKQFVYKGKEIPILQVFEETSISGLLEQLPEGWYPDIITCDTSAISYVPDIYNCPVKTIIFTRDSWSDTIFNRGLVEFFDFLNSSTIERSVYNAFHVNILPLRGFAVSTPAPGTNNSDYKKRDIDVVAIANYDNSFYHERHKVFYNLSASLGNKYNINFLRSIERSEIYNYYQRSKIVLDWAHTLSNRSYEAALNGCLLFSHEDNKIMSEFWVPWEEYIPYNEDNLPDLVSRYLDNPEMSKRITENAMGKINQVPLTWGDMAWDRTCAANFIDVNIHDRIEYNGSISPSTLFYRTATPLLYNYEYGKNFPGNWSELYFERIDKAILTATSTDERILPLVEASRMAFLLGRDSEAIAYLAQLDLQLPEYAWIHYLKARIAFKNKEYDNSLVLLSRALACGRDAPELLQKYIMPVIEKGNACDGRRVTNYMWQSVYNHNNEYQVEALFYLSFELAGFLHGLRGEKQKAIDSYLSAVESIPFPDCIHRLSPLLIEAQDYATLSDVTDMGHKDSPYDTIVVLYRAFAMIWSGQRKSAARDLKRHRAALNSFKGIRQITLVRIVISGLIPLLFASRGVSSLMMLKLVNRIKSKSGFTYLD